MIDNIILYGTSSSRSGSSSTSRSGTSSTTNGKTLYTLPDGKSYSLTKDQFDEFNNVYNKAYGIAYSMKSAAPRVSDVLKYGYAVLDSYERGIVFNESDFLAMMGAKQQQHEQQTNTSAAVSNPNDFETLTLPDHTTVTVPKSEAKALKEFMQIYDLCMEYAYPKLASPKWSDVVKYGNEVLDWYRQGIPFDAAEYERRVMAGESAVPQPQDTTPRMVDGSVYDVEHLEMETRWRNTEDSKRTQADGKLTTTPPEVKIPDSVVPQSDEKSTNWTLIGIVGAALLGVGALLFGGKSKKKRR